MEQRIERLEAAIERHEEQIIKLFDQISGLKKTLVGIQNTLNQIKYIATGMIAYFVLQEFGFFAAFKAVKGVI